MKTSPIVSSLKTASHYVLNRLRSPAPRIVAALAMLLALCDFTPRAWAGGSVVICELYGGGGGGTSVIKNDYVVLFNRSASPVSIKDWSLQYSSATGNSWSSGKVPLTNIVTLAAGQYYSVKFSAGTVGSDFTSDWTNSAISMAAGSGKIALVNTTNTLGAYPNPLTNAAAAAMVADIVSYGAATPTEGSPESTVLSVSLAAHRATSGCQDTDNNVADFSSFTVTTGYIPNNSSTAVNVCANAPIAPYIITQPVSQAAWITTNVTFTVQAGGDPTLSYIWKTNGVALVNSPPHVNGATSSTLVLSNVTAADNATYTVTVHSSTTAPDVTSDGTATLTVTYPAPSLVYPPQSQTDLRGTAAFLTVGVTGVPSYNPAYSFTYLWETNNGAGWTAVADGGRITGSATKLLKISNVGDSDAVPSYRVTVTSTGPAGTTSTTSDPATFTMADSGTLVKWDFNNPDMNPASPGPSQGEATATAALVGGANGFLTGGTGTANDSGTPNNYWGTDSYPSQYTQNKSSGVRFNVSTVGFKDVNVAYDYKASATASEYQRLQYTTDGSTFIDFPASFSIAGTTWNGPQTYNLAGLAGVRENPNFGIRIVSEFQSTATGGVVNSPSYAPVTSTSSYGTSGTLNYDLVTISVTRTNGNTPPTISPIADVVTPDTAGSVQVNFSVSGAPTLTVSAVSRNTAVLSNPNVDGGNTFMTLSPVPGQDGQAPILVTVTDGNLEVASTVFMVTVNPPNAPPTITGLPLVTNMLVNGTLTIPVTVTDDHTASGSLLLSTGSSNTIVMPNLNITLSADLGAGLHNLVITPAAGAAGVVPISVVAEDLGFLPTYPDHKFTTNTFVVIVRPSTSVVFNDFFDYPAGSLITNSCGLWQSHSGTYGQMAVQAGGLLNVAAGNSEDVHVALIGAPYSHLDSSVTLYSSFLVRFYSSPSAGGSYFAHFRDEKGGAATGFGARLWASTDNAASGKFRLAIGNGQGAAADTVAQFVQDLSVGTTYTVVTRFVPSTGIATLWINPVNESSTSVTATDVSTDPANVVNQIDVTSYGFREAGSGEGSKYVDSLRVGTSFAAVMPTSTHIDSIAGTTLAYSGGLGSRFVLLSNTPSLLTPVWIRAATNATSPDLFTIPAVGGPASPVFYRIQSE